MTAIHVAVVVSALLCSLVAGFLFAFAAVIMPGMRHLDEGGFLRALESVERVQNGIRRRRNDDAAHRSA